MKKTLISKIKPGDLVMIGDTPLRVRYINYNVRAKQTAFQLEKHDKPIDPLLVDDIVYIAFNEGNTFSLYVIEEPEHGEDTQKA